MTVHIDLAINFKARVYQLSTLTSQNFLVHMCEVERNFPLNLTDVDLIKITDKDNSLSTIVVSSRPNSFFGAHATIVF